MDRNLLLCCRLSFNKQLTLKSGGWADGTEGTIIPVQMLEKVAGKVEILKSRMSLDGSSGEGGKEGMRRE